MTQRHPVWCMVFLVWASITFLADAQAQTPEDDYDPITFEARGEFLVANGTVDDRALFDFMDAIRENPSVTTLVLAYVPGSVDDDANLMLGRVVRSMGLNTIIPKNGLVSSGGTDLFLAGKRRVIGANACIGVHSWDDEDGSHGNRIAESDPIHQVYLRYFRDLGIDPEFYWYTLDAASATDMHWMNGADIQAFQMATDKARQPGPPATAETCNRR